METLVTIKQLGVEGKAIVKTDLKGERKWGQGRRGTLRNAEKQEDMRETRKAEVFEGEKKDE